MSWGDFVDQANGFSIFSAMSAKDAVRSIQQVASDRWVVWLHPPSDKSDGSLELASGNELRLRINWMRWKGPGSPLSNTILGAHTWARAASSRNSANQADALARIGATEVLLGIVAEPPISDPADDRFQLIVSVLAEVNGLLFNGWAMADASGETLVYA